MAWHDMRRNQRHGGVAVDQMQNRLSRVNPDHQSPTGVNVTCTNYRGLNTAATAAAA